jgi:site-specific DNA recombinase
MEENNVDIEKVKQIIQKLKIEILEKELQSINKELQGKSTYFQKLYEDRTNGILREKEFLILMNKYKNDNEKLEKRQKIVKKEISSTLAKKETIKAKKNIFKKYRHIEELSIEIVEDFIDKILIGSYDEVDEKSEEI